MQLDPLRTLSKRERETAELVGKGLTNKEVAIRLGLSEDTVKLYVKYAMRELELRTRYQFIALLPPRPGDPDDEALFAQRPIPRERDLRTLDMLALVLSNAEIAARLGVPLAEVLRDVRSMCRRMGFANRGQAIRWWLYTRPTHEAAA